MTTISYDDHRIPFDTIGEAINKVNKYQEIIRKIPTEKWIRCKDIDDDYQRVACLLNKWYVRGWAKKRTVDDGFVEKEITEYEWVDSEGNFRTIYAYTEKGEPIGLVNNPNYKHDHCHKTKERLITKKFPASHIEFYVEPFEME